MLVNAKAMLEHAKSGKYAIPHFNINNLEWTRYILESCEEYRSPVILGVSEGAAKYMGGYRTIYQMVTGLMEDLHTTIPVCLHLDHGSSVESCMQAMEAGFTSIMIDGSKYNFETNLEMTRQVVAMAHPKNITVEAELGHIGGSEDEINSDVAYAKVDDCLNFVHAVDIDFLAPALGSVHGLYKGEPKLDFARMAEISEKVNLPLVLHGGSGIPDEMIQHAILCGICKLNINTELQIVWTNAVRLFLLENKEVYDPRKIIKSGEQALKNTVMHKLFLLGSHDKA